MFWQYSRFGDAAKRCNQSCTYLPGNGSVRQCLRFFRVLLHGRRPKINYTIFAANDSTIATYRFEIFSLELGLRWDFNCRFIVTDVRKPILRIVSSILRTLRGSTEPSAPHQSHYALRHPQSSIMQRRVVGNSCNARRIIKLALLKQYPEITRSVGVSVESKHSTKNCIHFTLGPPVMEKP